MSDDGRVGSDGGSAVLSPAIRGGDGPGSEDSAATRKRTVSSVVSGNEEAQDATPDWANNIVKRDQPLLMSAVPGLGGASAKGAVAKAAASARAVQSNDILNTLLPPITLTDEAGNVWRSYVSGEKSSRDDVYRLHEVLDKQLEERQARAFGICPVREEVYSQAFDELLRQIAIESPERGLMTLRVRDEIRMTIAAYQTLFQNSVSFGTKRAVLAEEKLVALASRKAELEAKKSALDRQVLDLKDKVCVVEERAVERTKQAHQAQSEERQFLKLQNEHLSKFLSHT